MKQGALHEVLPVGSKEKARAKAAFVPRTSHGGRESKGSRKTSRPFAPKASLHLVLKSARAKGTWSLQHRKNASRVTSMVYVYAARFRVHVYRFANVGNHLHLHVKAKEKKDLADFLRVLAGRVAVTVTGARKHVKRVGKFWDHLYWSRLVSGGRDFHFVDRYIFANTVESLPDLEKMGLNRKRLREETLKEGRQIVNDMFANAPPDRLPPWMGS